MDFNPLLLTPLPLLVLAAAVEGMVLTRRGHAYDWRAYWTSLGDALGRLLSNLVIKAGIVGVIFYAVSEHRVTTLDMDQAWHWLALFLGQEFCYYWMHRADHRVRWLWLDHSVHHSPNQFTLASAYRLGWTGKLTGGALFFAPLVWIGFPITHVIAAIALNLTYQFWLHTELIGRLPCWIESVFNTPAHHRVHHASNAEYIDRNYGGVLIVFDRMFGTFRETIPDVPMRYGLVHPIRSYNPIRVAFHSWLGMFRDLRAAHDWRTVTKIVLGPPEYTPEVSLVSTKPAGHRRTGQ